MTGSSPTLWIDPPESRERDWVRPAGGDPPRGPDGPFEPPRRPPAAPPPGRGRGRRLAAVAGAVVALGGAGAAGALIAGDDAPAPAATAAIPASSGSVPATEVAQIYEQAAGGVVSVEVQGGSGTGFVIDENGTIVTNAHVVGDSRSAEVRFDDDGDPVEARVLGSDASSDLAVLDVDAAAADLQPLGLADSDGVRVGDAVVAIGYPLGLDRTATAGIVSGVGREIRAPNGFSIDSVIQTDAPINPGNSGGPLLDARGRVIGVNSQIATAGGGGGNVGIGFAVPANTVREIVPKLQSGERIERPYLGVSTAAAAGGAVTVADVVAGSPAATAGLRPGDEIVSVAGREVGDPDDVAAAIADRSPGDRVEVRVRRGTGELTLDVELGTRPERSAP